MTLSLLTRVTFSGAINHYVVTSSFICSFTHSLTHSVTHNCRKYMGFVIPWYPSHFPTSNVWKYILEYTSNLNSVKLNTFKTSQKIGRKNLEEKV